MSVLHANEFSGAGKTYRLKTCDPDLNGSTIRVEGYWDLMRGAEFWLSPIGSMGVAFMMRQGELGFPMDEEIVYGKDQHGFGLMVHVTELGEVVA